MSAAAVATATSTTSATTILNENRRSSNTNGNPSNTNTNTSNGSNSQIMEQQQQQPQHSQSQTAQPQQPESRPAPPPATAEPETTNGTPSDSPLPADLKRILSQVGKTGACSWLSWDQDGKEPTPGVATAASKPWKRRRQPPRNKKHRNGMKTSSTRRRFASDTTTTQQRKRPLFLIRTNHVVSAGSVGSGRTSGSEPDDSTQYECDSEGTSATTNSEVSVEQRLRNKTHATSYKTLQEAFRVALGLVLDHFYRHCGGYKLSPAEKRRNATGEKNNKMSSEGVFQQRRQRLVTMLLPEQKRDDRQRNNDGPPFTIQRIAEVLVSPERYYTQTHKLCNCLEKLLLVTSSTGAFGGSIGGDTSQSRREERELAALADEKGRQESELRQRRLRRRTSSPSDEMMEAGNEARNSQGKDDPSDSDGSGRRHMSPDKKMELYDGHGHSHKSGSHSDSSSREMLEAAARASLRTKFDHVGIDPHSSADRDARSIAESRGMTNSPPPPSLAMAAAASNIAHPGHGGVGFVRQHLPDQNSDHPAMARVPSPILFSQGNESSIHGHTAPSMHMLQLHHAAALAGIGSAAHSHLDLTLDAANGAATRTQGNLGGSSDNPDLETEHGRSSASNSDVDSESDDNISLDDSASDRSDGSDSGSVTHYEPFTAARAMALNRMQQQQRLQSRVLTSLSSLHQSEGFRPPADSEYQSGDSIDSMRAEDSGGSDSSSSDLAD